MFLRSKYEDFSAGFSGDDAREGIRKALAADAPLAESKPLFADIAGNTSTTATITIGGSATNSLEVVGDTDWFRIDLNAGDSIAISLTGTGPTPVGDPLVTIRDAAGNVIASNDDGGPGLNSLLNFVAQSGGTYYIEVDSYQSSSTGSYTLSVEEREPLPHFDYDQIASQLTHGYWDGAMRAFDVGVDGQITVNLTALTADGQLLATRALELWSDVTGINFVQTAGAAEITFDDDEAGAFAGSTTSGTTIVSSNVNVSTDWIATYGTGLNTYSFQTYIHEIGHALGLGHAGNYNGSASYAADALYDNDAWSTTVMSYFDQNDNSYFAAQGFSFAFITSPMNADVVAMAALYGLSTTTRTANTVYGFNSSAGRDIFNANLHPNTAYTIVDSGGNDTLDYSGFTDDQRIDLNEEAFSDVGGLVGNVVIARGTVIELAVGGSGDDTIIGNDAKNRLTGGAGNDDLSGGRGIDTLFGDAGNDLIDGGLNADNLYGGDGNDTVIGGSRGDHMYGDAGDDNMQGNGSSDDIFGGAGNDTIIGNGGPDKIYGEAGSDNLTGASGADTLNGGADNDTLKGSNSADFFEFDLIGASHADNITDFKPGTDTITLDRAVFSAISADGTLASSAFRAGANALDASDRIIYNQATGELFYDSDGNGAAAKVLFATVDVGLVLSNTDFSAFSGTSAAMPGPESDKPLADLTSADAFLFM